MKYSDLDNNGLTIKVCTFVSSLVVLSFPVRLYMWAHEAEFFKHYPTANMNQVASDWNHPLFTTIVTTNSSECPETYPNSLLYREWLGTTDGCDCAEYDGQVIPGNLCDSVQFTNGCQNVYALGSIKMDRFNGTMVCAGTTNSVPYTQVDRPLSNTSQCKEGEIPCSRFTDLQNTICVVDGE